jgi:molybdopterin-guanine dinucleotide biosynthesis protein A
MGRPKHALRLPGGKAMIEVVAGVVADVCAQVVIVGGEDALPGVRRLDDLRPRQGPLGGIEALLASGLDTEYLVCPCDVPLITAELLRRLAVSSHAPATVFRVDGEQELQPLPARLSAGLLETVRKLLDEQRRAVHELISAVDPEVITVSRREARQLLNVNTPEDYSALMER